MNQNSLSITLKTLIDSQDDLSEAKLCRELNIPQPTLHRLVNGATSNPTVTTLLPIAEYFKISLEQLLGLEPLDLNTSTAHSFQSRKSTQIPLIPWEEVYKHKKLLPDITTANWEEWVTTNLKLKPGTFALQIEIDTIPVPYYENGTILIIEPSNEVKNANGHTAILCSNLTQTAYIRKVLNDGDTTWLLPIHSVLQPEKMDNSWMFCGIIRQHILTINIKGDK